MTPTLKYQPVRNLPVARFWYQGTHSHPVRRTILVVESDRKLIRGYELREGNTVRSLKDAPIKSYRRDKIAVGRQLRADCPIRRKDEKASTYQRAGLLDIIASGI